MNASLSREAIAPVSCIGGAPPPPREMQPATETTQPVFLLPICSEAGSDILLYTKTCVTHAQPRGVSVRISLLVLSHVSLTALSQNYS